MTRIIIRMAGRRKINKRLLFTHAFWAPSGAVRGPEEARRRYGCSSMCQSEAVDLWQVELKPLHTVNSFLFFKIKWDS